jgi:hypothetical protein
VYIRNNNAVVYVDRNRFDMQDGGIYWAGKKVGFYDRKGCGEINGKPIHIYKTEAGHFVLAELRQQQVATV